MALPCSTTGSLYPSFDPARLVCLTVKQAYAIALHVRLPSVLSGPLKASDTFLEATTPVKLPTKQCPSAKPRLDSRQVKAGISLFGSTLPGGRASKPPSYSTHHLPEINV